VSCDADLFKGREVTLDIFAFNDSENMRPLPFRARFTPRSQQIQDQILADAKVAREELRRYDGETHISPIM